MIPVTLSRYWMFKKANLFIIESKSKCNRWAIRIDLIAISLLCFSFKNTLYHHFIFNHTMWNVLANLSLLTPFAHNLKKNPNKSNPNKRPYNFFIVTLVCIIWNVFPPIEPKHLLYFCVGRFYALTYYNMWKEFERYNDFYDEILFGDAILWCVTLMFFDTLIEIIDNKSELIKKITWWNVCWRTRRTRKIGRENFVMQINSYALHNEQKYGRCCRYYDNCWGDSERINKHDEE